VLSKIKNEREEIKMKSYDQVREEFSKSIKRYNTERKLKLLKVIVLGGFLVSFIASANAEIREFQVREEYAMRDNILAAQMAPVFQDSEVGATMSWDNVIEEANRLTNEWVMNGRP
jgi:hypothetical protein